jgi:hypothetical protein
VNGAVAAAGNNELGAALGAVIPLTDLICHLKSRPS